MVARYPEEDDEPVPCYDIPARRITSLEHPLIIKDLDKGLKTFGNQPDYGAVRRCNKKRCKKKILSHPNIILANSDPDSLWWRASVLGPVVPKIQGPNKVQSLLS